MIIFMYVYTREIISGRLNTITSVINYLSSSDKDIQLLVYEKLGEMIAQH